MAPDGSILGHQRGRRSDCLRSDEPVEGVSSPVQLGRHIGDKRRRPIRLRQLEARRQLSSTIVPGVLERFVVEAAPDLRRDESFWVHVEPQR